MRKLGVFLLTLATIFSLAACKKKTKTTDPGKVTTGDHDTYITPDVEGNLIENGNFNSGEKEIADSGDQLIKTETGEWWVYGLDGGAGQFDINEKRQLEVGIVQTGKVMHGVQFAYDGFALIKGNKYCFEFDAFADINRHMEVRIQYNGAGYENYILEGKDENLIVELTPEMQHYKFEFACAATDPAPRMAINLGLFEGDPEYTKDSGNPIQMEQVTDPETGMIMFNFIPYEIITFDNFVLKCTYDSGEVFDYLDLASRNQIALNQVGFYPNQVKQVIVRGEKGKIDKEFKVLNVETNEYYQFFNDKTGEMQDYVGNVKIGAAVNPSSMEYYGIADISNITTPGRYKIVSKTCGESYEFAISDTVYDDLYNDVVMMLYRQRCGEVLGATGDKFAHAACHQEYATEYGGTTQVEVSGGWHDAGDYGKYVVAGAQTVADLLMTYERVKNTTGALNFAYASYVPQDSSIPDLLEEAMWELDWMLKMQKANGEVYHKVTTLEFPAIDVSAVDDHGKLYLSATSYAATADFAAVMAMAYRVLKDANVAETQRNAYLAAAKKAYNALSTSGFKVSFKNPDAIKTGEYPDGDLNDELAWACIELYAATNDDAYLLAFKDSFNSATDLGLGWANVNGFAAITALECIDKVENETLYNKMVKTLLDFADELVAQAALDCYNTTIKSFEWGSNLSIASNGMILDLASKLIYSTSTDEDELAKADNYVKVMHEQLNYLLGQNACCYCFVTGYGGLTPESPHHRPSVIANEAMVGMLVGGPDSNFAENGNDSVATRYCTGHADAHCYVDHNNSWSTNEVTIYWNSPLIYLLAAVSCTVQ